MGITGCAGLGIGAYKMLSIDFPPELRGVQYPLRAKEAIFKTLHWNLLEDKLEHLAVAKDLCARRYGHVSPQYSKLLCYEAKLIEKLGDCQEKAEYIRLLQRKPHVGEAVVEEVARWKSVYQLLASMQLSCPPPAYDAALVHFEKTIRNVPEFIKKKILNE